MQFILRSRTDSAAGGGEQQQVRFEKHAHLLNCVRKNPNERADKRHVAIAVGIIWLQRDNGYDHPI
ncbi:hypothetical protein [Paraburkholderia aspalathi]|uniref:hypothetical protein n=1 Tax=Paraburkholderia aspalathi TaxID=1324617 RepID=UPI0038BB8C70